MTASGIGHTLVVVLFVAAWVAGLISWCVGALNLFRFLRATAAEPFQVRLQKTFGLASMLPPPERLYRRRTIVSLLVFIGAFTASALVYWLGWLAGVV
jgi:hypothetical protein